MRIMVLPRQGTTHDNAGQHRAKHGRHGTSGRRGRLRPPRALGSSARGESGSVKGGGKLVVGQFETDPLPGNCLRRGSAPEGLSDSSPALQRWVKAEERSSPVGTTDHLPMCFVCLGRIYGATSSELRCRRKASRNSILRGRYQQPPKHSPAEQPAYPNNSASARKNSAGVAMRSDVRWATVLVKCLVLWVSSQSGLLAIADNRTGTSAS
jgi:hypothetical protein